MKAAVVTGAGSGIGLDCTRELLERGWRVFALDRSNESLSQARQRFVPFGDRCLTVACDVSVAADVAGAFRDIAAKCDRLDALVCSAGIFRTGPLLAMAEEDFDALFAVNAKGAWLTARAALPLLERGATPESNARIVFLGSIASIRPKVGGGAYSASKTALAQMARVLAVELAPRGILVNVVAPATVDTPMTRALQSRADYKLSGVSPLGRVAAPADVTGVITFLLGPEANYVTGAVLPVDGGTSAAYDPK